MTLSGLRWVGTVTATLISFSVARGQVRETILAEGPRGIESVPVQQSARASAWAIDWHQPGEPGRGPYFVEAPTRAQALEAAQAYIAERRAEAALLGLPFSSRFDSPRGPYAIGVLPAPATRAADKAILALGPTVRSALQLLSLSKSAGDALLGPAIVLDAPTRAQVEAFAQVNGAALQTWRDASPSLRSGVAARSAPALAQWRTVEARLIAARRDLAPALRRARVEALATTPPPITPTTALATTPLEGESTARTEALSLENLARTLLSLQAEAEYWRRFAATSSAPAAELDLARGEAADRDRRAARLRDDLMTDPRAARWVIEFLPREAANLRGRQPGDATTLAARGYRCAPLFPGPGDPAASSVYAWLATRAEQDAAELGDLVQNAPPPRTLTAEEVAAREAAGRAVEALLALGDGPAAAPVTVATSVAAPTAAPTPKPATPTPSTPPAPKPAEPQPQPTAPAGQPLYAGAPYDPAAPVGELPLVPPGVSMNRAVTQADLLELCRRVASHVSEPLPNPVSVTRAEATVSRADALAGLLKTLFPPDEIRSAIYPLPTPMPPDSDAGGASAKMYIAKAVTENWWKGTQPFDPKGVATWQFVNAILERMPH